MNTELSKIIQLINQKSFQKAETLSRKELAKEPNSFTLNKALAISLLAQKKYNQSLISFNKCYELTQNDYDINVNIALIFNKVQDYQNAIFFSEQALQLDPSRPEVYHNLAHSYLYIPDLEKAEKYILKSIELRGGIQSKNILRFKDTLNIYTDVLLAKGDKIAFKKICLEILDTEVYFGDIFRKLLRHERKNISDKHIRTLENILIDIDKYGDTLDNKLTKAGVYSCLAEYFEKINKEKSEGFYEKSNLLITSVQRESIFDRQSKVNEIRNFFKDIDVIQYSKDISPNLGDGLIFIIGMPRSGSTLIEQILGSHSQIDSYGEVNFLFNSIDKYLPLNQIYLNENNINNLDEDIIVNISDYYLKQFSIKQNDTQFVTDKMLFNYLFIDLIKILFPSAKIVFCFRDFRDIFMSIIRNYFGDKNFNFAYNKNELLNYINFFSEHMKICLKKYDDILFVNYESLILQFEKEVTTLLKKLDLSIEDSCLNFQQNSKTVNTASSFQVRQKIYDSSVNLWQSYKKFYKEEFDKLEILNKSFF